MNGNQFIVTGNLGTAPEHHRKSEESSGVVSFTLAQNVSRFSERTGKYEQVHTNWFQVRAFGRLGARALASLKKGDRVTVFGKIRTFQYEDQSGSTRYGFEVLADDIVATSILPSSASASGEDFASFQDRDDGAEVPL